MLSQTRLASRVTDLWNRYDRQGRLQEVTYNSNPAPTMNYTTGAITQTATTETVDMLITGFDTREIDGMHIAASDEQALIPQASLTATPTNRDTITYDNIEREVYLLGARGNGTFWRLRLRRPGVV